MAGLNNGDIFLEAGGSDLAVGMVTAVGLRSERTDTLPRSGFILRSPARVSRKREFS